MAYWNRRLEPSGDTLDGRGFWRVELEGPSVSRVHPLESPAQPIGWSDDGRWIYAMESSADPPVLQRIPADGGAPATIAVLPWSETTECDSVDMQQFVCTVNEGQSDVWIAENFDPDVPPVN